MLINIFQLFFSWSASTFFLQRAGGQPCISVCPVPHSCSVSVCECGPSVSTCRNNLPRWSRTDLTSADKLYLAESSCMLCRNSPSCTAQICNLSDSTQLKPVAHRKISVWHPHGRSLIILVFLSNERTKKYFTFPFRMFHFPQSEACMCVPTGWKVESLSTSVCLLWAHGGPVSLKLKSHNERR